MKCPISALLETYSNDSAGSLPKDRSKKICVNPLQASYWAIDNTGSNEKYSRCSQVFYWRRDRIVFRTSQSRLSDTTHCLFANFLRTLMKSMKLHEDPFHGILRWKAGEQNKRWAQKICYSRKGWKIMAKTEKHSIIKFCMNTDENNFRITPSISPVLQFYYHPYMMKWFL